MGQAVSVATAPPSDRRPHPLQKRMGLLHTRMGSTCWVRARSLLRQDSAVLRELDQLQMKFEMAIGYNGRIWIKRSPCPPQRSAPCKGMHAGHHRCAAQYGQGMATHWARRPA